MNYHDDIPDGPLERKDIVYGDTGGGGALLGPAIEELARAFDRGAKRPPIGTLADIRNGAGSQVRWPQTLKASLFPRSADPTD